MPASLMRLAAHPPEAPEPTTVASYTSGRGSFCVFMPDSLRNEIRRTILRRQREGEGAMNHEHSESAAPDSGQGPMRHFRIGRRAVLQSLATGAGAVVFAAGASAQHVHH